MSDRVYTNKGLIKDVEANVLKLCIEAFEEDEYLLFSSNKPALENFVDMDITRANVQDLPVLYVWVDSFQENPNQTGSLGRHAKRESLTFRVFIFYATDFPLPKEGEDEVKYIGWNLKEKLTENTNLNGIVNESGKMITYNHDPDIIMRQGKLAPVSAVKILMEYKLVRKRQRTN